MRSIRRLSVFGGAVAVVAAVSAASPAPALESPEPGEVSSRSGVVQVKFAEGTGTRLRGQDLVSPGASLDSVRKAVDAAGPVRLSRLFTRPEAEIEQRTRQLRDAGKAVPDLNLWYRITTPSPAAADALAARLRGLAGVAEAVVEPAPAPAPASPDFTALQMYRASAPGGIDAFAAAAVPGGAGDAVKITDVEYSWNAAHEDLTGLSGSLIANGTPCDPFADSNHGTAVLGQLRADPNAFGVSGLVPASRLSTVNAASLNTATGGCEWRLAEAVAIAAAASGPGDVVLIEQQAVGPNGGARYVPAEWISPVYDAIATATAAGVIVVEAAGNGNENLDAPAFGSSFPLGKPDSGAIIVGAAEAPGCGGEPALSRAGYSTYGTRVSLQGWGECVTTTGYGDLFGLGTPDTAYTSSFNGTSSAAPIVTAAVAALSSATETRTGVPMTPSQARQVLVSTGTAQFLGAGVPTGHIGPMPNLAAALSTGTTSCTISGTTGNDTLTGTSGADTICGLAGNDLIKGQGGNDTIIGGKGTDTVVFDVPVSADLTSGTATGQGSDTLVTVENITGSSGVDRLRGSTAINVLIGNGGDDALLGEGANDKLYGLAGNDSLTGGSGTDLCDGGTGTDRASTCESRVAVP